MIFSKTFHQLEPSLSPIREANRPQDADVTNVNRWCFLLNDILQVSIGVLIQKPIKRNQLVRTLTMERTNWEENGSSSESILTDAKERLVQSRELASVEVIWHLVLQLLQRGNPTCAQSLQAFLGKSGRKPLDYMAFKTSSTSWKRFWGLMTQSHPPICHKEGSSTAMSSQTPDPSVAAKMTLCCDWCWKVLEQ